MTHVHDLALVEWDRFIQENGLEATHSLRFVCAHDVWRAFTNMPGQIDGFGGGKGGFIAEWKMEIARDEKTDTTYTVGSWSKIRTTAKPKETVPQRPAFWGGERW